MKKNESGQSMVETALLLPVLLLLLVGILDFGRVLYSYAHLHMAAQESVRVGSLGRSDSEIIDFARNYVHLGDSNKLNIEISPQESTRNSGEYMNVTLKYPFQLYTPLLSKIFPSPLVIETESTIRVE
jgi:Flp pilus assembly protein TadG